MAAPRQWRPFTGSFAMGSIAAFVALGGTAEQAIGDRAGE
jgi:hypothetical protein